MTWVKLDDGFTDHPKVIGLSDKAFRVHVRALCYCARFSPGVGLIPKIALPLMGATKPVINELVAARLWDVAESGEMTIHDFPEFHPKPDREAKANAGRVGGLKSGEARRQKREAPSEAETKQGASSTNEASGSRVLEAKRSSRADPGPTRPSPTRPELASNEAALGAVSFATDEFLDPGLAKAATRLSELGISLTGKTGEMLKSRLDDGCKPEWIILAAEQAVAKADHPGWNYIASILDRWERDGGPPQPVQRNQPTPLPVRRSVSFDDPDYVGNMRKRWPTEEEMRAKEARQ